MRRLIVSLFLTASIAQAADTPPVPPPNELRQLLVESLLAFNQAVAAKDFTAFHASISALWQQQITPAKMKETFQPYIDKRIDLSNVVRVDPVYSEPAKIDENGVLIVQGVYPTSPSKVDFRLKYLREKTAWKLIGIKLDVQPADVAEVKVPSDAECKALVRESLLAFNEAVQAKNFETFHKTIATPWQKQVSPEKLLTTFQTFVDQGGNIAPVAKLEPTFSKPPAIDENDLLQLEGGYSGAGGNLSFNLAYLFETPKWRLVKINVHLKTDKEDAADEEDEDEGDDEDESDDDGWDK